MDYFHNEKGFYLPNKEEFYSDIDIINLILEEKEIVLDFQNKGEDCLIFLYYSFYPVLIKNLLKVGQYLWVNPTVHLDINTSEYFQEEIIKKDFEKKSPRLWEKLLESIKERGTYFPFYGKDSDIIWFGKHRWYAMVKNQYNQWFLYIVANDQTEIYFPFPVIEYKENESYKVFFSTKILSLHSNSQISKTKAFVNYSDFMGKRVYWLIEKNMPPLDFIENMSNFRKFLGNKDQWEWLSKIKYKI